ncbi:hypothetical protein I4F81_004819 [Pyropia yezoensis]|uniref:Uncharacterized protein n=1 Tax=Pyropia yezoensis TaxID=2788 RepID=A0ACC3BWD9_PYRYE|nr:hypothetical protein I4F81_004819 [Neopyropia yezoensis]
MRGMAILPGPGDPGPALLPSPPLHRALLPAAAASAGVTRLCAPGVYTVGGRPLLGVPAGALTDHGRYVRGGGGVAGLATLLTHRCVAPTAPDTLGVVPTEGVDPVVLAGGGMAAAYALGTEWGVGEVGGIVTVTVPPFAEGGVVAALNLNTMAVRPLRFGGGLGG